MPVHPIATGSVITNSFGSISGGTYACFTKYQVSSWLENVFTP
jgi:hypothetical protein